MRGPSRPVCSALTTRPCGAARAPPPPPQFNDLVASADKLDEYLLRQEEAAQQNEQQAMADADQGESVSPACPEGGAGWKGGKREG